MVSQHSPTKAMGAIPGFLTPSSWTFWVEAIEPSDTIADVAFTLTPDNVPANSPLIETVRVTTVVVDLGTINITGYFLSDVVAVPGLICPPLPRG